MNLRRGGPGAPAARPHSLTVAERLVHEEPLARRHVLDRAYPIAKQLAEILELEFPDLAASAVELRRAIAARSER
jgi:hypothetical protein